MNKDISITPLEIAKAINDLIIEKEKLQKRLDKAIEYLETATIDPQSMLHYRNCLLEILKGSDN